MIMRMLLSDEKSRRLTGMPDASHLKQLVWRLKNAVFGLFLVKDEKVAEESTQESIPDSISLLRGLWRRQM